MRVFPAEKVDRGATADLGSPQHAVTDFENIVQPFRPNALAPIRTFLPPPFSPLARYRVAES
jgi:hypothetical protein